MQERVRVPWRPVSGLLLAMLLLIGFLYTQAQAADPFAPAEFTVTDRVLWTDIEPIGVNLTKMTGGTNFVTNNFILGGGMEPARARYLIRVERHGDRWLEWELGHGGIHMYDQNASGFGDGAEVRFYRIVDKDGEPLSYTGGTDLWDNTGADRVIYLGQTTVPAGGWIAEGSEGENRVYLSEEMNLAYGDHAIITVKKMRLNQSEVHPRLHQWFDPRVGILSDFGREATYSSLLVPHPGNLPQDFEEPGETCLFIEGTEGLVKVGQYLFHAYDDGEGRWYSQLEPGAPYRAEVWLRQEGISGGKVRFVASGPYRELSQETPWTVSGEWAKYSFEFEGGAYPAPGTWHGGFGLEFESPGKLWVDNFVVYRNDAAHGHKPFTPHRLSFDELMAAMPKVGIKPAVRFYTDTYPDHSTMDRLLSRYGNSIFYFIGNVRAGAQIVTIPLALEWCYATGPHPAERVVPYLTLSEEFIESDWVALAEYLGVPYDPRLDTPQSKPWAHRRYQQRGHGVPWTEEFREIVVEMGNETWHAGVLAGWHGFGRPGYVHHGGREYGLFAKYYFSDHVMAQPWWSQHNLSEKIKFALGGNYTADPDYSYGEVAVQAAPSAISYLGHANYVGPKWETGDIPYSTLDDHGMQETLVGGIIGTFPLADDIEETRQLLAASGKANYRPIAYEGGPGGYYLPGNGTAAQVAISQVYGKSAAMAVGSLDTWLYSSLKGYRHQCFYAFRAGKNWTSHTMPRAGGFRRHASWLALMLRNQHVRGTEMLEVTTQQVPTYSRSAENVPLTSAYAIRGVGSCAVFVLSRKLDGEHDGVDFQDGTTPVTVHLPFSQCRELTRHAITLPNGNPADPRDMNLFGTFLSLTSKTLDPNVISDGKLVIGPETGGVTGGLPQGAMYLYTFELGEKPDGDLDGDGDSDLHDALRLALCLEDSTAEGCSSADLDQSGLITGTDYLVLDQLMSGE